MGSRCLIWGTPAEVGHLDNRDAYWVESPRAGGRYEITDVAATTISDGVLDDASKAKLTTLLIDRRGERENVSFVDLRLLEAAEQASALPHVKRAERLLKYIADRDSSSPSDPVSLTLTDPGALAHSESWSDGQISTLIQHLEREGWLTLEQTLDELQCTVTVSGHDHVAGAEEAKGRKAFVAMWFDTRMNDAYKNGIEPGIRDAGFVPIRIDEKKDANRIDDDIISAIKESRFVVADMTHGRDGVRGSVYYEAGFARGRGLEVIHCCRSDCIDGLPFDTRQYHHIVWDNPPELRRELAARIRARIGSPSSARE